MSGHRHNIGEIRELTTHANESALNAALAERGITIASVITVLLIAGSPIAGGAGEQYRVLYRQLG